MPAQGGAHLHIDGGDLVPELQIEGALAHVDACWKGGTFSAQAGTGSCWQGGCVTGLVGLATGGALPALPGELLVLIGGQDTSPLPQTLDLAEASGVRAVWLVDVVQVQRLVGPSGGLATLEIVGARELADVELPAPVQRLFLSGCASLATLRGRGACGAVHLHDRSGTAPGLDVDLPCDELIVADSRVRRLRVVHSTRLYLLRCFALHDVSLADGCLVECEGHVPRPLVGVSRVFANEALLGELARRYAAGDMAAWPELSALVHHAGQPRHAPAALRALRAVLAAGADPAQVWEARNVLNTHNQQAHRRSAAAPSRLDPARAMDTWRWRFSPDLAIDGWRDDLALWVDCGHLSEVEAYVSTMARELCKTPVLYKEVWPGVTRPGWQSSAALCRLFTEALTSANAEAWHDFLWPTVERLLDTTDDAAALDGLLQAVWPKVSRFGPLEGRLRRFELQMRGDPVGTRLALSRAIGRPPEPDFRGMSSEEFCRRARILMLSGRLPPREAAHAHRFP